MNASNVYKLHVRLGREDIINYKVMLERLIFPLELLVGIRHRIIY